MSQVRTGKDAASPAMQMEIETSVAASFGGLSGLSGSKLMDEN